MYYMKIDSELFKFIVMISHTWTPNNGGTRYFVMHGDIVHKTNNSNNEFTNSVYGKYSEKKKTNTM